MLFSATLSLRVMELAYEHLNDARKIEIRPEQVTADRVTQVLYHVSQREKIPLLIGLLRRKGVERTMLFVNTKRFAERLVSNLERHGFRIGALTGDIPQARRLKILQDFKSGALPLLVATDVASRGLHIDGVTHVVNVDLPQDPEDYVHRIGRTARAGHSGKAISLADEDYVFSLDAIQRLIGMKIPVEHADDALLSPAAAPPVRKVPLPSPAQVAPPLPKPPAAAPPVAAPLVAAPPVPAPPVPAPQTEELRLEEAASARETAADHESVTLLGLGSVDFWTREAFGLEVPHGGFGAEPVEPPLAPAPSGAPAKRRRRRRGRRVAGRVEAAAPA
jgi:hypothetical protein